jgi:hypothetical protein
MWVDANADGVATRDEMRRPESFGLTSFATIPKVRRYTDPAGNSLPYWAWASAGRRARAIMVDVFFLLLGPAIRFVRRSAAARETDLCSQARHGNRWHSERTASCSCASFAGVACACIASRIHCAT